MLKTIIIVLILLVVVVLAYAATKPGSFSVQRSISINAPAEKVFPLINDYRNWASWSPYEKLDPNVKKALSGPASGKGAVYVWNGNRQAGEGRMEIVESVPSSRVRIKLDFTRPMEGHNTADFTLVPEAGSTRVTWAMSGPMPYIAKVMSVFFNLDKMIGKEFEEGLANLKTVAEKDSQPATTGAPTQNSSI